MTDIKQGAGRFGEDLTPRDRFRRTMHYQYVDYVSNLEFGYWDELKEDWMQQGRLPPGLRQADGAIPDRSVEEFFGVEQIETFNLNNSAYPLRAFEIVEETAGRITFRDGVGILKRQQTEGMRTIPHFLEFPVRDRATWEAFRDEFLDPDHPQRVLPEEEMASLERMSRASANPVSTSFGSFIGRIRDWVGFEHLAYMSVDDPDLVEEMVAHLCAMQLKLLPEVLRRGQIDVGHGWEDICFNSGPLLSPRFFAERIMPHARPVLKMLRQHGVDVIWTDCDGNVTQLVPLWLEAGLNCMFPLEVNAGNDLVTLRRDHGHDLLVRGAFNKFALHQGRPAILKELLRLEPFVADGGFIPHVDHRCPGAVSFDAYCYFMWEKCHLLGWPEDKIKVFPAFRDWRP